FSYNVAYAVFGGLTPLVVTLMMKDAPLAPAHYVAALCLVGIATTIGLRWLPADSVAGSEYGIAPAKCGDRQVAFALARDRAEQARLHAAGPSRRKSCNGSLPTAPFVGRSLLRCP